MTDDNIITEFGADLDPLLKALDEAGAKMDRFLESTVKAGKNLSVSLDGTAAKATSVANGISEIGKASEGAAKSTKAASDAAAKSIEAQAVSAKKVADEQRKIDAARKESVKAIESVKQKTLELEIVEGERQMTAEEVAAAQAKHWAAQKEAIDAAIQSEARYRAEQAKRSQSAQPSAQPGSAGGTGAAEAVDALAKKTAEAGKEGQKTSGLFGRMFDRIKGGAGKAGGEIQGVFGSLKSGVGGIANNIGQQTGEAFASLSKQASDAGGVVIQSAGKMLSALGPVGIAVAAVGALIVSAFASTDEGKVYFDGLKNTATAAFSVVMKSVRDFVATLNDTGTVAGKVFAGVKAVVEGVYAPVKLLAQAVGSLFGITEEGTARLLEQGMRLAQMEADASDAADANIVRNATLEKQINKLNIQLRDRTKSQEELKTISRELGKLEAERLANELTALKATTAAAQERADQELKNAGSISKETKRLLSEAIAAEIQAEKESDTLREKAANRINAFRAQDEAARERAAEKAKAAREKAAAEEEAAIKRLSSARETATKQAQAAADALYRASLTPEEQTTFDIQVNTDQMISQVEAAFDELKALALARGEDITGIEAQRAQAITDITRKTEQDLQAIAQEAIDADAATREEAMEALRQGLASRYDLEIEAANARYDALREAAEVGITDEEERNAKLLEIEQARLVALGEVRTDADIAEQEREMAHQEAMAGIIGAASSQLNGLLEAFASGQIESAEEAGKALAKIAIDTVGTIVQAAIVQLIANSAAFGSKAGPVGAAVGLAAGTAMGAIIKGLLNNMLSSAMGHAEGTPWVSGRPDMPGKDGYLRRLDYGERVVSRRKNLANWDAYEAIDRGKMDEWVAKNYGLGTMALNFRAPSVAGIMEVIDRRGGPVSVTMPKGHDRRMVRAAMGMQEEQRRTNRLLSGLQSTNRPQSKRYR